MLGSDALGPQRRGQSAQRLAQAPGHLSHQAPPLLRQALGRLLKCRQWQHRDGGTENPDLPRLEPVGRPGAQAPQIQRRREAPQLAPQRAARPGHLLSHAHVSLHRLLDG